MGRQREMATLCGLGAARVSDACKVCADVSVNVTTLREVNADALLRSMDGSRLTNG